jgi:60 kDa SS-A/Ro ribonucleoprotein
MTYAQHFGNETDQQTPLPGMVKNSAGGTAYPVNKWTRLERFLILGAEGGTYYIDEKDLVIGNAKALVECLAQDPILTLAMITDISVNGKAPKNDPAIFALAVAASFGLNAHLKCDKTEVYHKEVRQLAFAKLNEVCRIGTHLFMFIDEVKKMRGMGMGLRKAIRGWYSERDDDVLGYQLVKYKNRQGWTHRDVLRLVHDAKLPKRNLLGWLCDRREIGELLPNIVVKSEILPYADNKTAAAKLIVDNKLPREVVPTEWLNDVLIWEALLEDMPITAMIRNLGKMTEVGLLKPMSKASAKVVSTLTDESILRRGRVHPFSILLALTTYSAGRGVRGSLTWTPIPQVMEALQEAFYLSFDNVESTGKRHYLGLDVSRSMSALINNTHITCAMAAAALTMVTARTEDNYYVGAFSAGAGGSFSRSSALMKDFPINRSWDLNKVITEARKITFGRTDCALPMVHALEKKIEADVFVIYTDSETWAGKIQPVEALQRYRDKMGINAKLVVVGMASNGFSIADPNDGGMFDVCGMSTSVPSVINNFITG